MATATPERVTFREVLAAQTTHNEIQNPGKFSCLKLDQGESIEGVLLGAGFHGGVIVLLRWGPMLAFALNGHRDLTDRLAEVPIGAHVKITLLQLGGPKHGGGKYRYEVEQC